MKRLQVRLNGEWKYVFCRESSLSVPVITEHKEKALREKFGDGKRSLEYFENHFGHLEFRLATQYRCCICGTPYDDDVEQQYNPHSKPVCSEKCWEESQEQTYSEWYASQPI